MCLQKGVDKMIYLFQRIILNHFQWTRPSPGRLGPSGEGKYVQKNGFGHEDWNFNKNLLIDGLLYGYCKYQPAKKKRDEEFNIVFATHTNKKWYLIGFYLKSRFVEAPPVKESILSHKMDDLLRLDDSLGKPWHELTKYEFIAKLEDDAKSLKWSVEPSNAIRTSRPVEISKDIYDSNNYRIGTPTNIDESTFTDLCNLAKRHTASADYGSDSEFPEGIEIERKHKQRERNQAVIKEAKNEFKGKYGRLYCQVCGFDFYSSYGEIGQDYIECHHILPISKLRGEIKTKVSDIALVCSNCHRMLHRKRPWLKMSELKDLIA